MSDTPPHLALRIAAYEIDVLRSIIVKLVDSAGITVHGKWLSVASEEYGTVHPFTPEELEILGRIIDVVA